MTVQTAEPDVFRALADPTRRRLLERLAAHECAAGELTDGLSMSQGAVSQHLKVLRECGLVNVRTAHRHRYYRLRPDGLASMREWLDELDRFWASALDSLGDYLDRT